ncbi:hypothetical protein E4U43_001875 [Claviceps pusilla]|uniref:Uncharacterized protein n=1 Tax=Claviceps pusilla TaxID=123648 RepID=A0A9P7T0S8_9HYPO|nr:hypothetical protein E4U43_001875 [Claviceps pusilla]
MTPPTINATLMSVLPRAEQARSDKYTTNRPPSQRHSTHGIGRYITAPLPTHGHDDAYTRPGYKPPALTPECHTQQGFIIYFPDALQNPAYKIRWMKPLAMLWCDVDESDTGAASPSPCPEPSTNRNRICARVTPTRTPREAKRETEQTNLSSRRLLKEEWPPCSVCPGARSSRQRRPRT